MFELLACAVTAFYTGFWLAYRIWGKEIQTGERAFNKRKGAGHVKLP